jgi:chaperonin GroEL
MSKQILSGVELRKKLLSGVKQLSDVVSSTLGPLASNVGIQNTWTAPQVVHDGWTVARNTELENPFEDFAISLVKQAASKTVDVAGDGTSTSTLLAYEIVKRGFEKINEGANAVRIKKGLELALDSVLKYIKKEARPIKTNKEIEQVAFVSSGDIEISKVVAEVLEKLGPDGVINVIESERTGIQSEFKEGMSFDSGFISPMFATNENGTAEIESPHILLTDMIISSPDEIAKFLQKFTKETSRAEIVIVATDIVSGALSTILINKTRGGIIPLGIFAPGMAERKKSYLEDIAVLTNAKVLYKDSGMKLEDVTIDMLGKCDRVISDSKETKIIGGFGKKEDIEKRVKQVREELKNTNKGDFEKEKLKERLSKLVSGACIISVGDVTPIALSDKIERVRDSVEAAKCSVVSGILPGCGIILLKEKQTLKNEDKDIQVGIDILMDVLDEPIKKLLSNAGLNSEEIIKNILSNDNRNYGYDVVKNVYGDLYELGILDSAMVVMEAIKNATSVATMLITTENVIVNIPEKLDKTN